MHETRESEEKLLEPLDGNENTIAHLAAEDGNTSVFKVCTHILVPPREALVSFKEVSSLASSSLVLACFHQLWHMELFGCLSSSK